MKRNQRKNTEEPGGVISKSWEKPDFQTDDSLDIEERVDILRSIKTQEIENAEISRKKVGLAKDTCDKYESFLSYMCLMTYVSTFLTSIPPAHWMGLNKEGVENSKLVNEAWMSFLIKTKFPKEFFYTLFDSGATGAGYLYLGFVDDKKKIKFSKYTKGEKKIVEEEKRTYYGPKVNYIPFENLFHNGRDIDSATEAALINPITMKEFEMYYVHNDLYHISKEKLEGIKNSKKSYAGENKQDIIWIENDYVEIVEHYCVSDNSCSITANGIIINTEDGNKGVNPYPHCQIPFMETVHDPTPDNQSGTALMTLIQEEEKIYNTCIQKMIQIADLSVGVTTTENIDDLYIEKHDVLGTIINGHPEDIQFKNPQYNPQIFQVLADIMLQNAILKTIDFTNQITRNQYETSRSVAYRQSSSDNRTNTIVGHTLQTMFSRLSTQWLSIMQDMWNYDDEKLILTTKNKKIDTKSKTIEESPDDSFVELSYEDLKGAYEVFLDVDKLIGPSKDEKIDETLQLLTGVSNLADPKTGEPIIPREQIAEVIIETLRYNSGIKLTKNNSQSNVESDVQDLFGEGRQDLLSGLSSLDPNLASAAAAVSPAPNIGALPTQGSLPS